MENASKALIIAGGVLIAIMILTMGVYLIGQFGKTSDSYVTQLDTVELHKYNSNFEVFLDRTDITAQEIVTVISMSQQKDQGTKVYVDGNDVTNWGEQQKNEFLEKNILIYKANGTAEYTCMNVDYDSEGKVIAIWFKIN